MAAETLPFYNAARVREAASGRWLEALHWLAGDVLQDALARPGRHVTCPIHGTTGKTRGDGFRLFNDVVTSGGGICNSCGSFPDGFELLMWLRGWNFRTTLARVAGVLRVEPEPPIRAARSVSRLRTSAVVQAVPNADFPATPERAEALAPRPERLAEIQELQRRLAANAAEHGARAAERIERTWKQSTPLDRGIPTPLFRYLKNRCVVMRRELLLEGDNVRFHAALPYYEADAQGRPVLVGKPPAMVAAVRDLDGRIVTLHRTYLSPQGAKARIECPRKMMTVPSDRSVTGAAIQLGGMPREGVLGIAEGIETALSAMRMSQVPTWSAVSATILEKFQPPKGVRTLLVWADRDRSGSGERAAQALKDALAPQGIDVRVFLPLRPIKGKGVDWNDVLRKEGILGFPAWPLLRRLLQGGAGCAS